MSPRSSSTSLMALAGLAALHAGPAVSCHVAAVCDRLPIRRRLSATGAVALTFDDGPHPQATPCVLKVLAAHDAVATFFLVGEQVRRHPALAREIVAAGHAVGLHGETHRNELMLSPRVLAQDRARGLDAIQQATGVTPVMHRPPYGAVSGAGLVLARGTGLETVLWSRWGRDWRARATADTVARDVLGNGLIEGEIILLHDADHYGAPDCWRSTVAALPRILDFCSQVGLAPIAL
jgi:peptidoglycan/xylan/chitin deacetylase (PgdA/CDA1 family)